MKPSYKLAFPVLAACLCFAAVPARASVTLQFSQVGVGRATGFANSSGVATNGMRWGIVVDTLANGISGAGPTMYDPGFDLSTAGFLMVNNVLTDDYYVPAISTIDLVTPLVTSFQSGTGGDVGGNGGITAIGNVPFGGGTGISTGDPFGIIWFESGSGIGNSYGVLENQSVSAEFDIPADGNTTSFASTYFTAVNPDAIKPANLMLTPEPSRFLLLGLGGIGLLLRRRRN